MYANVGEIGLGSDLRRSAETPSGPRVSGGAVRRNSGKSPPGALEVPDRGGMRCEQDLAKALGACRPCASVRFVERTCRRGVAHCSDIVTTSAESLRIGRARKCRCSTAATDEHPQTGTERHRAMVCGAHNPE